jgi:acyl dehydratase
MTTPSTTITDDMRSHIGVESQRVTYEISKWDIARFACAIGDPNPLYSDTPAAHQSAIGSQIAPPIFLRSLLPDPGKTPFPEPFAHILDAGSNYRFFQPVRVGDSITVTRSLKELYTRIGRLGEMLFKIREITYTNQSGQVVAVQESTTITYGEPEPAIADTGLGEV